MTDCTDADCNGVCVSSSLPMEEIEAPQFDRSLQAVSMMFGRSPEELNVRSLMSTSQRRIGKQSPHFLTKLFKSPETSILEVSKY